MVSKVLIVDDEPDLELLLRQRFRRELRDGTYEFLFARNGEEALAAVGADPHVEVVLSDINMPVMDGLTLLARLREGWPGRLGTVIVSAYGDLPNIRAAMNQGAFDFLTKPIDFRDFEVTLQKTLAQVRERRQAAADRDRLVALQRDLQTAAAIQQSFLPPAPAPFAGRPDFAVHASMAPAREVGGDFYDYFLVGPDRVGVVVGDVSGKGVPAALYMAVARTLLRAAALRDAAPADCLAEVNRLLLRDSSAGLFVTLLYAVLDTHGGELLYANGGHNPAYLLRGGAAEALPGRGLPVGVLEEATYETFAARLAPGDGLFLYSDGITEARGPAGQMFGEGRLREALGRAGPAGPEGLVRAVLEEVRHFSAGAPQADDETALALRYAARPLNGQGEAS